MNNEIKVREDGTARLVHQGPAQSTPGEEVVTRREAAGRAGVHYNTIKAWEKAGRLASTRIGKRVWIKLVDLEEAIRKDGE